MNISLTSLGLLCVSGHGAKDFLQGQLTCHLDDITGTEHRLAAHCNPQGRVISLFRIFLYQNNYYLQMPRELIPIAMKALKKYAVFYKVNIEDASEALLCSGVIGEIDDAQKQNALVFSIPGKTQRYQIITEKHHPTHSHEMTADLWKHWDILSGIPTIYPETSEKFLPHEMNLPTLNAVSFTKGCFTGQEIIARMQYRGKLKTYMVHASVDSTHPPVRGDSVLHQEQPAGHIVDYVSLEYNHYDMLIITSDAMIQLNALTLMSGENITLNG